MRFGIRVHLLAVALAGGLAFAGSLANGFVWDDFEHIIENPYLRTPGRALVYFTEDEGHGSGRTLPYYRPLTMISFALDRSLWGENPAGYHGTSLLLHMIVCALAYLVVRRLTAHSEAALFAALLFAVHPAHAEPVGYIAARADLLCGLLLAAAFLGYLRHLETGRKAALAGSLLAYALALLSKVVALVFPALLFAHWLLFPRRERSFRAIFPYIGVAAAYFAARSAVLDMEIWGAAPLPMRFATAATLLVRYLRNALFPMGLKVFYDVPARSSFGDPVVLASLALLAAAACAALRAHARAPKALFGAAWFFATLLPVTGIVSILYPSPMADRYLYIPLFGFCIAAGSLAAGRFDRRDSPRDPWGARVLLAVVVFAFAALSWSRVGVYKDPLTLWKTAAAQSPSNAYVLNRLGCASIAVGRYGDAMEAFGKVLSVEENDPAVLTNMGFLLLHMGATAEAEGYAWRALDHAPAEDWICRKLMGQIYAVRGDLARAEVWFRQSLAANPHDPATRRMLDTVLGQAAACGPERGTARPGRP